MLTQEQFVKKANNLHKNKYEYCDVYKGNRKKLKINCPVHGLFVLRADQHLQGRGCQKCSKRYRLTNFDFKQKASLLHKNYYDYSLIKEEKILAQIKYKIICPKHGIFEQLSKIHLKGSGCKQCFYEKLKINKNEFIEKAKIIHKNSYSYEFKNNDLIYITCPKHGKFKQSKSVHLKGQGCFRCACDKFKTKTDDFIEKAKTIHGKNKYDYNKINYINQNSKIKIFCQKHGFFWQKPTVHLQGHGCQKCCKTGIKLTKKQFTKKANKIHDFFYDYSKFEYINSHTKSQIVCPKHGLFLMKPNCHLSGKKCPKCRKQVSKNQEKLYEKLKNKINETIFLESKIKFDKKYFLADIVIPHKKIIIEYNGDYWHCNPHLYGSDYFNKRKNKTAKQIWQQDQKRTEKLEKLGYKIFVVWENDFKSNEKNVIIDLLKKIKDCTNE